MICLQQLKSRFAVSSRREMKKDHQVVISDLVLSIIVIIIIVVVVVDFHDVLPLHARRRVGEPFLELRARRASAAASASVIAAAADSASFDVAFDALVELDVRGAHVVLERHVVDRREALVAAPAAATAAVGGDGGGGGA